MRNTKLALLLIASLLVSGCGSMLAQSKHQEQGGHYHYGGVQTDLAGAAAGSVLPFQMITQETAQATPEVLAFGPLLSAFFIVDIPFSLAADSIYSLNLLARGKAIPAAESPKQVILICQERGQYRVCSAAQGKCWCEQWKSNIEVQLH